MTNTGSVLDTYLIAQALGWDWNIWTMLTIDFGIFLIGVAVVGVVCVLSEVLG